MIGPIAHNYRGKALKTAAQRERRGGSLKDWARKGSNPNSWGWERRRLHAVRAG